MMQTMQTTLKRDRRRRERRQSTENGAKLSQATSKCPKKVLVAANDAILGLTFCLFYSLTSKLMQMQA
jgi:hypothetical protein